MKSTVRTLIGASSVLVASVLIGGCAVVPAPVPVALAADDVYAPAAPPPPQVEVIPVAPFVGAVWVGGYWNWVGGRHVWVPGRYVRPNPGYRWQPHHWVQRPGGGWWLRGGVWIR